MLQVHGINRVINKADFIQKVLVYKKDYFLMLYLVLSSANPFLREQAIFVTFLGVFIIILLYPNVFLIKIKDEIIPLCLIVFFVSFEILHRFLYNLENTSTILKIFGYFIFSYFTAKALRFKFIHLYIKIVYYLSLVGLIFFVVLTFFPFMYSVFTFGETLFPLKHSSNPTILIYTFDNNFLNGDGQFIRNSGFSWEAGGFAIYTNIALSLYIFAKKLTLKQIFLDRKSFVLILSIISTFSTTGYLALFFILLGSIITIKGVVKYIVLTVFVMIAYFLMLNIDFLGNKIFEQVEVSANSQNRIGSGLLDWEDIRKKPLIGWSRKESVLFGKDAHSYLTHRPNGLTNFLRNYGFIYFGAFIILWIISFNKYFCFERIEKHFVGTYIVIMVILIMAFSQLLFDDFIFKSFMFLFVSYKENRPFRR